MAHDKTSTLSHTVEMSQEKIDRYGKLNGDWDILHYDHDYCIQRGFRGTLAHGMHNMAPAVDLALERYGRDFYYGGRIEVRWTGPVCPGDRQLTTLDPAGKVTASVGTAEAGGSVMIGRAVLRAAP
jgi:acyl dehydratase